MKHLFRTVLLILVLCVAFECLASCQNAFAGERAAQSVDATSRVASSEDWSEPEALSWEASEPAGDGVIGDALARAMDGASETQTFQIWFSVGEGLDTLNDAALEAELAKQVDGYLTKESVRKTALRVAGVAFEPYVDAVTDWQYPRSSIQAMENAGLRLSSKQTSVYHWTETNLLTQNRQLLGEFLFRKLDACRLHTAGDVTLGELLETRRAYFRESKSVSVWLTASEIYELADLIREHTANPTGYAPLCNATIRLSGSDEFGMPGVYAYTDRYSGYLADELLDVEALLQESYALGILNPNED